MKNYWKSATSTLAATSVAQAFSASSIEFRTGSFVADVGNAGTYIYISPDGNVWFPIVPGATFALPQTLWPIPETFDLTDWQVKGTIGDKLHAIYV